MASVSVSELSSSNTVISRIADDGAHLGDACQELGIKFARNLPVEWIDRGKASFPQVILCGIDAYIKAQVKKVFLLQRYKEVAHLQERVTAIALERLSRINLGAISNEPDLNWKDAVSMWEFELVHRAQVAMMKGAGWEVFEISEEDHVPKVKLSLPIQLISCFEYALLRAGVEEMFPLDCQSSEILDRLKDCGFVSVHKPKAGDLVVFLEGGLPVHMGIVYKNKVLSKPGNLQKFAFVHELEDASEKYGNEVIFLRRSLLT